MYVLKRNAVVALLLCALIGTVAWARVQQSRNGQLTVQDYMEIQQLYARYNHAIDSLDAEGLAALFTADGSVSFYKGSGHDALVDMINKLASQEPGLSYLNPQTGKRGTYRRHWNSGLVISGTTEVAKGAVYLLAVNVGAKPPVLLSASQYDDTLVKTPQGWRFQRRLVSGDGPIPDTVAPAPPRSS
jgi:hypothetical protein